MADPGLPRAAGTVRLEGLIALRGTDPEAAEQIAEAFDAATVLVLLHPEAHEGAEGAEGADEGHLLHAEFGEELVVPVFTGYQALATAVEKVPQWAEVEATEMRGADVLEFADEQASVVLNPFTDLELRFDPV